MDQAHNRRWPTWLAWALWVLAVPGLASVPWFDHLARQAGRPELTQLNASTIPYLLAVVIAATVGAVLASRLPRHPVGWLLLGVGRRPPWRWRRCSSRCGGGCRGWWIGGSTVVVMMPGR